jgi:hypothetical protein
MSYAKEYYKRNREEIIKRNTLYYQKNKIKYLDYMKQYNKEYYQKNKHNWNIRYNNMSLEEKQKYRKKYYQPKTEKKIYELKEVPYIEPNFLITFN